MGKGNPRGFTFIIGQSESPFEPAHTQVSRVLKAFITGYGDDVQMRQKQTKPSKHCNRPRSGVIKEISESQGFVTLAFLFVPGKTAYLTYSLWFETTF